jgi:hypothetical protein
VLAPYNVVGIVVGHTHTVDFYTWQGMDIFNAPAAQVWSWPPWHDGRH